MSQDQELLSVLTGKDQTPRVVGLAQHGDDKIRVYQRSEDGLTLNEWIERVYPFIFTSETGVKVAQNAVGSNRVTVKALSGENEMDRLLVFHNKNDFRAARKALYKDPTATEEFFTYGNPISSYLMQSGMTMFKGMKSNEVHRMQIDIESYRADGFPDPEHDPIYIISVSDNRGYEKAFYQTTNPAVDIEDFNTVPDFAEWCENEADLLRKLVFTIQRRNPDVLEGHFVFGFDLPYIKRRCELLDVPFVIGRDGREPYTYDTEKKFAERDVKYTNFLVGGRTIVDTMFMAIDWDVYTRELDGVGLKDVARTLGVAPKGRVYIEGDKLAETWINDPVKVLHYALDDVVETRGISEQLAGAQFALTQMMSLPYQTVHLGGKSTVIQSMFVREYLRQRESIPTSKPGRQRYGGLTEVFKTGVFDNIWYIDVASLYPSIMLHYDVRPEQDHLGLFQTILQNLTDLRFKTKREMKAAKTAEEKNALDAAQQAFKIIINSFYGMLGAGGIALFATVPEADRVAQTGQGLLRRMMEIISHRGGEIIECDTDGVLAVAPRDRNFETDGPDFCQEVTDLLPEGIIADFDGAYRRMMSLKAKNYALLDMKGNIKVKGGALKSRSLEPLFRDYIEEQIQNVMDRDSHAIRELHRTYQKRILSKLDPELLARTVTLKDSLEVYQNKVQRGSNRAPQYEIALDMRRSGRRVQKGDRISYVVTGDKPISRVVSYIDGTLLSQVRPGTHHIKFYLKKLQQVATGRFGTFFAEDDLEKVFPSDPPSNTMDMFGGAVFHGADIENRTVKLYEHAGF